MPIQPCGLWGPTIARVDDRDRDRKKTTLATPVTTGSLEDDLPSPEKTGTDGTNCPS